MNLFLFGPHWPQDLGLICTLLLTLCGGGGGGGFFLDSVVVREVVISPHLLWWGVGKWEYQFFMALYFQG